MRSAQSSFRNDNFHSTSKNILKNRNCTFPIVRYITWKLSFLSYILWMIADQKLAKMVHSESSQTAVSYFLKNFLLEIFDWVMNTPRQWPGNSRQIDFFGYEYFTRYKQFWFIFGDILNIFHFYKQRIPLYKILQETIQKMFS